jgi:hypothetical protein
MEPTQSSETLAYKIQTPGKFPEDYILQLQHGESLKTTNMASLVKQWQCLHSHVFILPQERQKVAEATQ